MAQFVLLKALYDSCIWRNLHLKALCDNFYKQKRYMMQSVRLKVKMKASISVERCRFSTNDFFLSFWPLGMFVHSQKVRAWCFVVFRWCRVSRRQRRRQTLSVWVLRPHLHARIRMGTTRASARHVSLQISVVNLTHLIPPVTIVTLKKLTFPNLTVDFQTIFNMNGSCSICSEHKISHKGNFFFYFDSCIIWKLNK